MKRVLVLRPEPGASATASRLNRLGFEPVVFPLGTIEPLNPKVEIGLSSVAAVAATSANGIRHAPPSLLHEVMQLPFYAVGSATGDAARERAFAIVHEGRSDGTELAKLILSRHPDGTVLYLAGRLRRQEFEAALAAGGAKVVTLETYDTIYPDRSGDVPSPLDQGSPDIALVHSPEAGKAFSRLIDASSTAAAGMTVIAISARAAEPFRSRVIDVIVAAQPSEDAMFDALARLV